MLYLYSYLIIGFLWAMFCAYKTYVLYLENNSMTFLEKIWHITKGIVIYIPIWPYSMIIAFRKRKK